MMFRPSLWSQVQLTTYAPNGGFPGFYGDGTVDGSPTAKAAEDKAKEDFSIAKQACAAAFPKHATDWKQGLAYEGCVATAEALLDAALREIAERVGGGTTPTTTTGGGTPPSTTLQIPKDLTASEQALLDACKAKPLLSRFACQVAAVKKINDARAKKAAGGGSSALWWTLGGVALVGGTVAAVYYLRKS